MYQPGLNRTAPAPARTHTRTRARSHIAHIADIAGRVGTQRVNGDPAADARGTAIKYYLVQDGAYSASLSDDGVLIELPPYSAAGLVVYF